MRETSPGPRPLVSLSSVCHSLAYADSILAGLYGAFLCTQAHAFPVNTRLRAFARAWRISSKGAMATPLAVALLVMVEPDFRADPVFADNTAFLTGLVNGCGSLGRAGPSDASDPPDTPGHQPPVSV